MLLRTKNWAWPCNSDPSNKIGCWKSVMLHGIASYEATSPPESSFAVNSNSSILGFYKWKKPINNVSIWRSSISKDKILMFYTFFCEAWCFVSFVVESNYHFYTHFFENGDIVGWRINSVLKFKLKFTPYLSMHAS